MKINILRKSKHKLLKYLYKTKLKVGGNNSIISFTFDDFPESAKLNGAKILDKYGVKGTFYSSLGFLESDNSKQEFFKLEDLADLLSNGHEIGCHTYDHLNAEKNSCSEYLNSILRNKKKFSALFPDLELTSFSYPFGGINLCAKRDVKKHYLTGRTNWAGINIGNVDIHLLKANKLYSPSISLDECVHLIDRNCREKGWLIFYTHDVEDPPSVYGCVPEYLESVVKYAVESGATVTSVSKSLDYLNN